MKTGNHMQFEEVIDLIAPTQATIDQVVGWFREQGIPSAQLLLHPSMDFLSVVMSVADSDSIFQVCILLFFGFFVLFLIFFS